jgi:hypothetical protein
MLDKGKKILEHDDGVAAHETSIEVQLYAKITRLNKLKKVLKLSLKPYLLERLDIYLLHSIRYETNMN